MYEIEEQNQRKKGKHHLKSINIQELKLNWLDRILIPFQPFWEKAGAGPGFLRCLIQHVHIWLRPPSRAKNSLFFTRKDTQGQEYRSSIAVLFFIVTIPGRENLPL